MTGSLFLPNIARGCGPAKLDTVEVTPFIPLKDKKKYCHSPIEITQACHLHQTKGKDTAEGACNASNEIKDGVTSANLVC